MGDLDSVEGRPVLFAVIRKGILDSSENGHATKLEVNAVLFWFSGISASSCTERTCRAAS